MSSLHNKGPILGLVFLALLETGCAQQRHIVEQSRDTVVFRVKSELILRDTVVFAGVPAGSSEAVRKDSDTSHLETTVAESDAWVDGGRLHHTLRNKSAILPVVVQIPERITTSEKALIRDRKVVEKVEVEKELSRWQNFVLSLGYSVLIAGAAWLAWKLSKIVRF